MDRWKAEQGRGREKRKIRRKKSRRERVRRKKRQVAKHCVFPMIWGPGGSKSRLAKAAGAVLAVQMRDEKLHAVVAWSIFPSQNVQTHTRFGPLLEVEMSKKCTPLWREAYFQVKMYKTHQVRTTFGSCDVEKVRAVFLSQNVQNTTCSRHFWRFGCWKSARRREAHFEVKMLKTPGFRTTFGGSDVASLHYTTLHYTPLHCTALHYTTLHNTTATQLHSTTLNHTTLHYTTLHSTTLHYTTLPSTTLHYITLHYTPLHYSYNYTTTLHYNTLHYTKLHYTPLRCNYNYEYTTTLHYTKCHYTTLHYTTLHYTTLHYTTLHYTTLHYTEWHCTTDRQVDR